MSEITKAIQVLCNEKGLDYEVVLDALESALSAAYRKDFGNKLQNVKVKFDPETGDMKVWDEKEVTEDYEAEELEASQAKLIELREQAKTEGRDLTEEEIAEFIRFNPKTQIMLKDAKEINKKAKLGDILKIDLEVPGDFGRMAAQTAKQVIIQKIREAERLTVFEDFKTQENQIVYGVVQRKDKNGAVIVDLGKITGILPSSEQVQREQYRPGARMQFSVVSVEMGIRGPEIILSRSSKKMIEVIFEKEIPEIAGGVVVIKKIARDAGSRSKVAVFTADDTTDPIGSCIGQRGSRINTIIDELGGEKIDVIQYNDNAEIFIQNALSPAKIDSVELDSATQTAVVKVNEDQFSLAIGRGGQNVRLAAELTGWKIKVIQKDNEEKVVSSDETEETTKAEESIEASEVAEDTQTNE